MKKITIISIVVFENKWGAKKITSPLAFVEGLF
jgi:hypothetical protein